MADLSVAGPTYAALRHKQMPLDEVLQVLRCEARGPSPRHGESLIVLAFAHPPPAGARMKKKDI